MIEWFVIGGFVAAPIYILASAGNDVAPCQEPRKEPKRIRSAPPKADLPGEAVPVAENPLRGDYRDGRTPQNWSGRKYDNGPEPHPQYYQ
jgi:hypothetical protein